MSETTGDKILIHVGYQPYSEFVQQGNDGAPTGYAVEILNKIQQQTNWLFEYIPCELNESISGLDNGTLDLVCFLHRTPEREQKLIFSNRITCFENLYIYTQKDNNNLFYDDVKELSGLTAGLQSNSFEATLFEDFINLNNITINKKYYTDSSQMAQALANNETDFNVHGFLSTPSNVKIIQNLGRDPFYFAMSKKDTYRMLQLDNAFSQILRTQSDFLTELHNKYFTEPKQTSPLFTRTEHNYISQSPVLRVQINNNAYPLEYIDSKTGEFCGVYADFLNRVSELSGLKFKYVSVDTLEQLLEAINNKTIDLIGRTPISKVMVQKYNIRFTEPFTTDNLEVIGINQNLTNISHTNIKQTAILPLEDAGSLGYLREKFPNWTITTEGNLYQALSDVSSKKYNIVCCNLLYLQTLYNLSDFPNLTIYAGFSEHIPIAIGIINSDDLTLRSILNKTIALIPESEIESFRAKNTINIQQKQSLKTMIKNNFFALIGFCIVTAITALLILRKREQRYKRWAMEDNLTGIWNNRKFELEAKKALERSKTQKYALFTIDINKFKFINQSYGTGAGDYVLQQMAQMLPKITEGFIYTARSFADRFYILLEVEGKQDAIAFAKDICQFNFEIIGASSRQFNLAVKIGIIMIDTANYKKKDSINIKDLIGKANIARHTIKENLTKNYAFYDDAMDMIVTAENSIEEKMENALETGQFVVYFQPKFDLKTEKISGAEALVRWKDPEKGMIPPDFFIPIFERNGFVIELDFFVYKTVFSLMRQWLDSGKKLVTISVNMSRVHVATPDFVERFITTAEQYDIDPAYIEIEVTESTFGDEDINVRNLVSSLKSKGFRISMDDFGAGYSSLNLLKEVPVDVLKIDRNFLAEATTSKKTTIIIEKVVEMARKIDIETVCEGVETRIQADFLHTIGCDTAQGYLFAKPMPPEKFALLLPNNESNLKTSQP